MRKIRCIDYCPIKDIPLQEDGFVPVDHRLEIYGFCKECLGNANILDDERERPGVSMWFIEDETPGYKLNGKSTEFYFKNKPHISIWK